MSPRSIGPFRVLQLVCTFLLLHHSNWQTSMVSGTGHQQSTTRELQHKSGLLGDGVTMCERTLNTDYTANLKECKAKANKLFPVVENIDFCTNTYCELSCQTELACQHCDEQLQDWLASTQTDMNSEILSKCQDSAGQFSPFMCPITVAPTTNLTTTTNTTHNSTSRAPFPKWAIYTLASGVIIVIVLVLLILWYGWSRFNPHASSHHHESDSKQSLKSTRTHKTSGSRGSSGRAKSSTQANQQNKMKMSKWHPLKDSAKKATASPIQKKASSGKVASRGKVTTSSSRRHEDKQQHHGPKMVNPKQQHSTGNVKKGH